MARCLTRHLGDASGALAPFEVGIAAQRAQAAAGRIHQHAIDLGREPLHARIGFAVDELRMHVRQPRALEPRLQVGEPLVRGVEGIQAALRVHQRTERQRLAAGAGAESPPPSRGAGARPDRPAAGCPRPALRPCLPGTADDAAAPAWSRGARPPASTAVGFGANAVALERGQHLVARREQGVDPQVERRGLQQPARELFQLGPARSSRARRSYSQSGRLRRTAGGSCAWSIAARLREPGSRRRREQRRQLAHAEADLQGQRGQRQPPRHAARRRAARAGAGGAAP